MTEKEYNEALDKTFGNEKGVIFITSDFNRAEKAETLDELIAYGWPQVYITDSGSGVVFFSREVLSNEIVSAMADLLNPSSDERYGYDFPSRAAELLKL